MLKGIGERIKLLREAKDVTQDEMAKELNVGRETVARWENGTRDIKTEATVNIAKFFNVSTDYLLGLTSSTSTDISKIGISNKTGFLAPTVERITQLSPNDKMLLDKVISKILEIDLLNLLQEFNNNNEKVTKLYKNKSMYNNIAEDEDTSSNTIEKVEECNGKFIRTHEYSELMLFRIQNKYLDIVKDISGYNAMLQAEKDYIRTAAESDKDIL